MKYKVGDKIVFSPTFWKRVESAREQGTSGVPYIYEASIKLLEKRNKILEIQDTEERFESKYRYKIGGLWFAEDDIISIQELRKYKLEKLNEKR